MARTRFVRCGAVACRSRISWKALDNSKSWIVSGITFLCLCAGVLAMFSLSLKLRAIIAIVAANLYGMAAYSQTFNFTPTQLIEKFNKQLTADKSDNIKSCNKT